MPTPARAALCLAVSTLAMGCVQTRPGAICPGSTRAHVAFDDMWHTLDTRYAVFAERLPEGDWSGIGEDACPELDAGVDDAGLFRLMVDALQHLDDGHTALRAPDLGRSRDAWTSVYPHYDTLYDLELNAEAHYLSSDLSRANDDWFSWGVVPRAADGRHGPVGYLSITSMDELSPSGSERPDVQAARDAMAVVLEDFSHVDGIVVDVRANEGGWDTVSLAIAEHFAGPAALVYEKQLRSGPAHDDFGPWKATTIGPETGDAYAGPVVLLTSGGTFSAAEIFSMAMHTRDHVVVMGEPTSGHLSDIHDRRLSNDWRLSYSGERYRAADGEVYEARGIPVDVAIGLDPDAVARGQDRMLEAALDHIAEHLTDR